MQRAFQWDCLGVWTERLSCFDAKSSTLFFAADFESHCNCQNMGKSKFSYFLFMINKKKWNSYLDVFCVTFWWLQMIENRKNEKYCLRFQSRTITHQALQTIICCLLVPRQNLSVHCIYLKGDVFHEYDIFQQKPKKYTYDFNLNRPLVVFFDFFLDSNSECFKCLECSHWILWRVPRV